MPNPAPKPADYTRRTGASDMITNVLTHSLSGPTHRRHVQAGAALAVIPLITLLAACGGGSSGAPAAQASNPAPTQTQNSGGQGATGAFPGASGLIAAASPGTLQVQSATAQNTVVYTKATTFTAVTSGHVAAGDCIIVTGTPTAGSTKTLTATSARIVAKVNGTCTTTSTGGSFGGGSFGGGNSARRPSGAPTGGSGARRAFASATGTVSSVSGSTILVTGILRSGPGAAGSTATVPSPATITITLGSSAAVTQTLPATSAAAVVGQCARAIGPADSTGTITAKSITVSKPGPNGCNTGFGGGGRGGANSTGGTGSNA